jgi:DNA-binding CsgD family transcriptional regulator
MNQAGYRALKTGQCGLRQGLDQRLLFDPPNDQMNNQLADCISQVETHHSLRFPNSQAALLINAHEEDGMADLPPVLQHRQFIAILHDPKQPVVVDYHTLARLYHLTAAESRLIQSLVQGYDVKQSADRLSISPHTARSHLKAIFAKTDTHRQSDLIRKVTLSSQYLIR